MRGRLSPRLAALVAVMVLVLGSRGIAEGCALDQKPSVFADGQLARLNRQMPLTQSELATWAWCAFPRPYAAGHEIRLTEDRRDVARTLMPAALRQPWGWDFGDGRVGYGWTVRHAYASAGHWRIRVYAFNPESKRWDLFDQVLVTVRG